MNGVNQCVSAINAQNMRDRQTVMSLHPVNALRNAFPSSRPCSWTGWTSVCLQLMHKIWETDRLSVRGGYIASLDRPTRPGGGDNSFENRKIILPWTTVKQVAKCFDEEVKFCLCIKPRAKQKRWAAVIRVIVLCYGTCWCSYMTSPKSLTPFIHWKYIYYLIMLMLMFKLLSTTHAC